MKIVTWNICCLPKWINQYQDPNICIYEIIKILTELDADIICLQELFDVNFRKLFIEKFNKYNIIYENTNSFFYFNSGLMILTKYKCIKSVFIPFKHSCGEDRFSNKGFLSVVLNIEGTDTTVINTHINNDEPLIYFVSPKNVIKQQQIQLMSYIHSINSYYKRIYLCGDFNSNKSTIIQNISSIINSDIYISGFSSKYTQITDTTIDHILNLSLNKNSNDKLNIDNAKTHYIFNTSCSDHCLLIKQL